MLILDCLIIFTQRFCILYSYLMNDIHNDFLTFLVSNLFLRTWYQKTLRWLRIWKNVIISISISKCKKSNELILCLTKHYYISFCVNILHSEEAFMHLGVFSELAVSLSPSMITSALLVQDENLARCTYNSQMSPRINFSMLEFQYKHKNSSAQRENRNEFSSFYLLLCINKISTLSILWATFHENDGSCCHSF